MNQSRYDEYKNRHTIAKRLTDTEKEECLEDYFRLKKPVSDLLEILDGVKLELLLQVDAINPLLK